MTTDLDQVFAEARDRALPPSRIDLDRVVTHGRRRRASVRAREGATLALAGAVVVGGAAWAVGGSVSTGRGTIGAGDGGGAASSAALGAPSPASTDGGMAPPVVDATATAEAPSPHPSDSAELSKDPANAPAALKAVALPDPAPGFAERRFPDSVGLTSGVSNYATGTYWTATFGLGSSDGGPQATVIVGDFPMAPTSGTPSMYASPGPITSTPTVAGHQAYITHDGDQTILYFRTSLFTVHVVGAQGATEESLIALAEGLRHIG